MAQIKILTVGSRGDIQPAWGKYLETLGMSPATFPHKALTQTQLEAGIRAIVKNHRLTKKAQQLRDEIHAEQGIQ